MTTPDLTVRGTDSGKLLFAGAFKVVYKGLTDDGRIQLVCHEVDAVNTRTVLLLIEPAVLAEIPDPAPPDLVLTLRAAEEHVLERHAL
ncbi:MAG TPA: hypothetical protein VGV89_10405 [Thermoplasmata archaeon]|nr:hypothetical protein [Thermoplasmata archaeon]